MTVAAMKQNRIPQNEMLETLRLNFMYNSLNKHKIGRMNRGGYFSTDAYCDYDSHPLSSRNKRYLSTRLLPPEHHTAI